MDGYHLFNAQLQRLGLEDRKGAPNTFDIDGYVAALSRVAADAGADIYVPDYDRVLYEPIAARLLVPSPAGSRAAERSRRHGIGFSGATVPTGELVKRSNANSDRTITLALI
jgi:hypothetical protein